MLFYINLNIFRNVKYTDKKKKDHFILKKFHLSDEIELKI